MVGPPMSNVQQPISTETALRLLTNQQRRQILHRLAETPAGTTVDELKKHLEEANPTNSGGERVLDSQFVELHHVHLPMLHEANVITYDVTHGSVQRGRAFNDVLSLLEAIDNHRKDTSTGSA